MSDPRDCHGHCPDDVAYGSLVICNGTCIANTTRSLASFIDGCGICNGNNSSCIDCAGVVRGSAVLDACGVCAGDNSTCRNVSTMAVADVIPARATVPVIVYGAGFDNSTNLRLNQSPTSFDTISTALTFNYTAPALAFGLLRDTTTLQVLVQWSDSPTLWNLSKEVTVIDPASVSIDEIYGNASIDGFQTVKWITTVRELYVNGNNLLNTTFWCSLRTPLNNTFTVNAVYVNVSSVICLLPTSLPATSYAVYITYQWFVTNSLQIYLWALPPAVLSAYLNPVGNRIDITFSRPLSLSINDTWTCQELLLTSLSGMCTARMITPTHIRMTINSDTLDAFLLTNMNLQFKAGTIQLANANFARSLDAPFLVVRRNGRSSMQIPMDIRYDPAGISFSLRRMRNTGGVALKSAYVTTTKLDVFQAITSRLSLLSTASLEFRVPWNELPSLSNAAPPVLTSFVFFNAFGIRSKATTYLWARAAAVEFSYAVWGPVNVTEDTPITVWSRVWLTDPTASVSAQSLIIAVNWTVADISLNRVFQRVNGTQRLDLDALSLPPGKEYIIIGESMVTIRNVTYTFNASHTLFVARLPLSVSLPGGMQIKNAFADMVLAPITPNDRPEDLRYIWSCIDAEGYGCKSALTGLSVLSSLKSSNVSIKAGTFLPGASVTFWVSVQRKKTNETANSYQRFAFVAAVGGDSEFALSIMTDALPDATTDLLVLYANSSLSGVEFVWRVDMGCNLNGSYVERSATETVWPSVNFEKTALQTQPNSPFLKLRLFDLLDTTGEALADDTTWCVILTAREPISGLQGSAGMEILNMYRPALPDDCKMRPASGDAFLTQFNLTCATYPDQPDPFFFRWLMTDLVTGVSHVTEKDASYLQSRTLPAGNWSIDVQYSVGNAWRSWDLNLRAMVFANTNSSVTSAAISADFGQSGDVYSALDRIVGLVNAGTAQKLTKRSTVVPVAEALAVLDEVATAGGTMTNSDAVLRLVRGVLNQSGDSTLTSASADHIVRILVRFLSMYDEQPITTSAAGALVPRSGNCFVPDAQVDALWIITALGARSNRTVSVLRQALLMCVARTHVCTEAAFAPAVFLNTSLSLQLTTDTSSAPSAPVDADGCMLVVREWLSRAAVPTNQLLQSDAFRASYGRTARTDNTTAVELRVNGTTVGWSTMTEAGAIIVNVTSFSARAVQCVSYNAVSAEWESTGCTLLGMDQQVARCLCPQDRWVGVVATSEQAQIAREASFLIYVMVGLGLVGTALVYQGYAGYKSSRKSRQAPYLDVEIMG